MKPTRFLMAGLAVFVAAALNAKIITLPVAFQSPLYVLSAKQTWVKCKMKTKFKLTIIVTLLLVGFSCKKEETVSNLMADSAVKSGFNFLKSTQASNDANQQRSSTYSALFEITKVERNKDILSVTVTFTGSCAPNNFEVIWNGLVMESYPEAIFLYLKRTVPTCYELDAYILTSRILTLDLTQCLGDASLAQRVKIILCNTSKKANTENSDISVPSN